MLTSLTIEKTSLNDPRSFNPFIDMEARVDDEEDEEEEDEDEDDGN